MGSFGAYSEMRREELEALVKVLEWSLREIETICTESQSALRKRMGTRVGNILVVSRIALQQEPR